MGFDEVGIFIVFIDMCEMVKKDLTLPLPKYSILASDVTYHITTNLERRICPIQSWTSIFWDRGNILEWIESMFQTNLKEN